MASELAAYYVSIIPSLRGMASKVGKEFNAVDRQAATAGKTSGGAFSSAFAGAMSGIAATLSVGAVTSFVGSAVQGAGQLEQSLGALDSVFKGNSGQMKAWSKQAATDVGLTQNEFNELGTLIGSQLKNGGTAMEDLAPKTKDLITMGADLSSMFGGSTKEAVDALSSALKGERDPIERYGVSLNQAKVDAEAAALGFEKVDGALSAEATQAATISLIMKQTADAHGNFAKESDTFAHKQQVLAARWGDLKTRIGEQFMPALSVAVGFLADKAVPVVGNMVDKLGSFAQTVGSKFDFSSFQGFFDSVGGVGGEAGPALASIGDSFKELLPAVQAFAEQTPDLATGGVKLLAGALGFLSDHVDTIIAWMPAIVAGFVAWRVAQIALNAAAAITPGLQLAVNISRISAARAEMGLAAAHRTSAAAIATTNAAEKVSLATRLRNTAATVGQRIATVASAAAARTAAAGQWLLNAAMSANPIGIVVVAIAALVAGLIWFFTQTDLGKEIVANAWAWIQGAVKAVVDWFNNTAMPIIQQVVKVVGAVFTWLYENIIKPVWEGIKTGINAAWLVISWIFQAVVAVVQKVLGPIFNWLWNSVIKPVFGFIGALIKAWWNIIVMPIFKAVWGFINDTLGPVFNWLWKTIIKPAFDGIGKAIKWVWENVIKPVFDTLSNFITKTIPNAFKKGVDFIKTHWNKIQDIAKAPIKFVIDTVINKGLIAGLNGIGGFLGLDKLPDVALPPGFANGGYTGDGGKYQPAGIVHAGEYVFTKEQTRRAGVGNLAALAHSLNGYARGGIVKPLKEMALTQGYNRVHKGIDLAAAVGTPVYATQSGVVSHAGPGARAPGVWGGNEIHVLGNGIETWFAHLSQIGVKLGQNVRAGQQIGLSGNTGISSGPHLHFGVFNGGWPNDIDPNGYLGGAGVPNGKPWNPIADIIGGLVDQFKKQFPAAGFIADLAIGAGKKILDGAVKFVTGQSGNDGSAVGPTLYDGGGWLHNTGGAQLVQHNKRKPDAVLSNEQWATMTRIAENSAATTSRPTVEITGPIHVRDENELARILTTKQMDAIAVYV